MKYPKYSDVFVYILIDSDKVTLRDLYYELDAIDILQLYELILCEKYNRNIALENEKNNMKLK